MTVRVTTWGGLGDVLLMTPALRAIKQATPSPRLLVSCMARVHYELLQHNPYIDRLQLKESRWAGLVASLAHTAAMALEARGPERLARIARGFAGRIAIYSQQMPMLLRMEAADIIAGMLNVTLEDRRIDVFLTANEEQWGREQMAAHRSPVVMQVGSSSSVNKNWPIDRWEAVVDDNPQHTFVQLGIAEEPPVRGAVDLRGRTSVREAMALVKYSAAFVGVDSFLAHVTNATNTPAVVVFGPTAADVWSHANYHVISDPPRCSPCIDLVLRNPCPYGLECLQAIGPERVSAALRGIFAPKRDAVEIVPNRNRQAVT